MALTGTYNFKGLDIPNAYIRVESANYFTDRTLEYDSTASSEVWVERPYINYEANIYASSASRASSPNEKIDSLSGRITHSGSSDASNIIIQTYEAIKVIHSGSGWTDC